MAVRYRCKTPHSELIEIYALKIFDTMKRYHGMGGRERLLLQIGQGVSHQKTKQGGGNQVTQQRRQHHGDFVLAALLRQETNLAGEKRIAFEANAQKRDGEHHSAHVVDLAGQKHAAADDDHDAGQNAVDSLFQHMVIFSSETMISPMR